MVTGGGWKSFSGQKISRRELLRLVEAALGIAPQSVSDTYGNSEINCVLVSCSEFKYHIPPLIEAVALDKAFFGAVDREGRGRIGFLDPFALSYPGFIITGDTGRLVRSKCSCGLQGPAFEGEINRVEGEPVRGCGGVMAKLPA